MFNWHFPVNQGVKRDFKKKNCGHLWKKKKPNILWMALKTRAKHVKNWMAPIKVFHCYVMWKSVNCTVSPLYATKSGNWGFPQVWAAEKLENQVELSRFSQVYGAEKWRFRVFHRSSGEVEISDFLWVWAEVEFLDFTLLPNMHAWYYTRTFEASIYRRPHEIYNISHFSL